MMNGYFLEHVALSNKKENRICATIDTKRSHRAGCFLNLKYIFRF
jgi:hypothetical protein